jgi:hypothetical protein
VKISFPEPEKLDDLVPIRLDMTIEGYRILDTFTWSLSGSFLLFSNHLLINTTTEATLSPEQFASNFCMESDLPEKLELVIAQTIRKYHYRVLIIKVYSYLS